LSFSPLEGFYPFVINRLNLTDSKLLAWILGVKEWTIRERCLATVKFLEHSEGYHEILDNRNVIGNHTLH